MNTTQQTFAEEIKEERKSAKTILTDSFAEGVLGGVVVVLALIGLSNTLPELMLPVSAIVMGMAFLVEGEAIAVRISRLFGKLSKGPLEEEQPDVGVTAEFLAGMSGVLLGLIGLLGLYPLVMVPITVIGFGSALIFGSGLTSRLNDLESERSGSPACFTRIVCKAVLSASGIEFLFGLIAGILGIIALTGLEAARMSLLALLIVGASSLLNGAASIVRTSGARQT